MKLSCCTSNRIRWQKHSLCGKPTSIQEAFGLQFRFGIPWTKQKLVGTKFVAGQRQRQSRPKEQERQQSSSSLQRYKYLQGICDVAWFDTPAIVRRFPTDSTAILRFNFILPPLGIRIVAGNPARDTGRNRTKASSGIIFCRIRVPVLHHSFVKNQ